MRDTDEGINKVPIIIALVLAILLVAGVIVGARVVLDRAYQTPVAVAEVPAPGADSDACHKFIAAAPQSVIGLRRAVIAEPAPAGVAVWRAATTQQITVRCGVAAPAQLTELSQLDAVAGGTWLRVTDTTPGSTLQTWYATDREEVVAVTSDNEALGSHSMPEVLAALSDALGMIPAGTADRSPIPLSHLQAAETPTETPDTETTDATDTSRCDTLISALPDTIDAGGVHYSRVPQVPGLAGAAAWTASGVEPIVVRCGVEFPPNYAAGAQLSQINEVPWFEDTTVGNGTTASIWYAVDTHPMVVMSAPQATAQAALVHLSEVIRSTW